MITSLSLLALITPAPAQDAASPPVWFREVGAAAGVDFEHKADRTDRYRFPEIMGGGVAMLDHDGDGDLDLYLVQGGFLGEAPEGVERPGNRLFRNDTEPGGPLRFTDVTEEAGVGSTAYGMGAAGCIYTRQFVILIILTLNKIFEYVKMTIFSRPIGSFRTPRRFGFFA